ncbi:MAG: hypothetical protein IMZ51_04035 [Chloroflexi bacterium]|nr:hypothetical protein [Chloroflexota bacterium]
METDPIIIRIQAIDEATDKINRVVNSLQKFKMPEMKLSTGNFVESVNTIKAVTKSATLSAQQMTDMITKNFQKGLDQMNVEPIERLDQTLNEAGITSKQFSGFLKNNNLELIKGVGVYDRLSGSILTQGQAVKLATIQTRRFKFEWLSIMFAGMALDRVFGSILKSQMQLWGISEGIASMWTLVMAPAMELISPIIWDIIGAIMELPPDTQLVIGLTVFGFSTLGKVLTALGQIFLAAMGIKTLFPSIGIAVAKAGGGLIGTFKAIGFAIIALGPAFWIIAGIAAAVALGIYLAWKTNFLGIKQIVSNLLEGMKLMFSGLIDFFKGIFKIIKGIITGDFSIIIDGIKQMFQGLGTFVFGIFITIGNAITAILIGALKIVLNVVTVIIDGVIWGVNLLIKAVNKVPGVNFKKIDFKMPSFQEGGIMPYTGMAYLHAGEKVIPKNQVGKVDGSVITFSPTISINAQVSSDYDVRKLADELNYYWAKDFERMIKGRVTT